MSEWLITDLVAVFQRDQQPFFSFWLGLEEINQERVPNDSVQDSLSAARLVITWYRIAAFALVFGGLHWVCFLSLGVPHVYIYIHISIVSLN